MSFVRIEALFFLILLLVSGSSWAQQKSVVAQKKGSMFRMRWLYQNFPLSVSLYELQNPKSTQVGAMGRLTNRVNTVLANRLPSDEVFVPDGSLTKVAMVVENNTNRKIYFNFVPYEISPESLSLGANFTCACTGHVDSVAPGRIWYRVVSLKNSTPKMGRIFEIRQKVLGLDPVKTFSEARQFQEDSR